MIHSRRRGAMTREFQRWHPPKESSNMPRSSTLPCCDMDHGVNHCRHQKFTRLVFPGRNKYTETNTIQTPTHNSRIELLVLTLRRARRPLCERHLQLVAQVQSTLHPRPCIHVEHGPIQRLVSSVWGPACMSFHVN